MPPNFQDARALGPAPKGPEDTLIAPGNVAPSEPPSVDSDSFLPTLSGPIGLYRVTTAEVGPRNHLRLALHGEYFTWSDLLIPQDDNQRLLGEFSFGITVHPNVEVFGALMSSSNRNNRAPEDDRRDPPLIKSFGDLVMGGKASFPVGRGLTAGFEGGLKFLSSISDLSFSLDSTSFWTGPVFTADLRTIANVPLRAHANVNFYGDNSRNLHDLSAPGVSQRSKWVAQFAYGMGASRFRAAVAIDAPLEHQLPIPIQPFLEYHAEVVTTDADPTFAAYMPPACGTPLGLPCKDNRDQQWVSVGLRARVWKGLTADAGVDIRIRSVGFAYGPPLPPYNVVFGLAYPLDIDAFRRPVIVTVEKDAAATQGRVSGLVKNGKDGTPVQGAIVAVAGVSHARAATDPDGSFQTVGLNPGPAALEISAVGFELAKVPTNIIVGQPVSVAVTLTPKVSTGNVRGKISDDKGQGLLASVKFMGPDNFEAKSDATGAFTASLPVGPYRVIAEAPGFPVKEAPLDIVAAQDRQLDFKLRNRPANANATLGDSSITLKRPLRFSAGVAPRLEGTPQPGLDAVAELLEDHGDIKTLRIEAHWDTSAGPKVKEITQQQADAIKAYLVKKGVAEGRLEAVGVGADRPLVPNIGPASKAKNRRVDLSLVK